ncbi:PKD domain-containing protein [Vibrio xiamenensis]|uniref:PKD domain-containing protein n=1 Tax=Vibrio xiamenensis TaxID=861298 RepID=A0A1G7XZ71_9VIBR|nr:PKD domain-containing protein [Vibrio xiamenensis]SDG77906.1 PKD domain-containing protein [Vibrio xiamenensis]SDG89393.1 PKD domain-containing protein [Vibrio xiamenensis]
MKHAMIARLVRRSLFLALLSVLALGNAQIHLSLIGVAHAAQNSATGMGLTKLHPLIQQAITAQRKHAPGLMKIDGVLGSGVGIDASGQVIIRVFVRDTALSGIPNQLDGIKVERQVTGLIMAQFDTTARVRPAPIGISSGHPNITAGTIGARVIDAGGNVYALSNNHVYADSNAASLGDNILQPGSYDGGVESSDVIGQLSDFEAINFNGNNAMDAAIAQSSALELSNATPSDGYGIPSGVTAAAALGQQVQKYGRTTSHTLGTVQTINTTVEVCYSVRCNALFCTCRKSALFSNQFSIADNDNNDATTFSAGGDSGSLIVTQTGNHPVGLLFAGGGGVTFASPIDPVLSRFDVVIDDGSGLINNPPLADFSYSVEGLAVSFSDTSSDSDGNVVSWLWDFGDGATLSGDASTVDIQTPIHDYSVAGAYQVRLTVTDDSGATDVSEQTVNVGDSCLALSAEGYKVKGRQKVQLSWSCAAAQVAISRDQQSIGSFDSDSNGSGAHLDEVNGVGGASYLYQLCNLNTEVCAPSVIVNL